MEDTVTQSGTHNGGFSNVVEIERLIIQKQLVMNQLAILLQPFFSGTFFGSQLGLTSVEGTLFFFFSFPCLLQLMSQGVLGLYNFAYSSIYFTTNPNLVVQNDCMCVCVFVVICSCVSSESVLVCIYTLNVHALVSLLSPLTSTQPSADSINSLV